MSYAVFVYGTLRPGESGAHFWSGAIESVESGALWGAQIFNLGPYPMAIRGPGEVHGEVLFFAPEKFGKTLARFDAYEGAGYERELVSIETARGKIEAWVYLGRESVARRGRQIAGGDWKARFKAK